MAKTEIAFYQVDAFTEFFARQRHAEAPPRSPAGVVHPLHPGPACRWTDIAKVRYAHFHNQADLQVPTGGN